MKKDPNPLILGASIDSAGIGGVTIHVQRLMQWLDKYGFEYHFCDYKKHSIKEQFCEITKHKIVHIHISRPLPRLVYILYSRLVATKSILTVHGNIGRFSWLKNLMDQLSVRLCNVPILINVKSYEIAKRWNNNSVLLSAFLPPIAEGTVPDYVYEAINNAHMKGRIVVVSNASVMSFTDFGEEIYGIGFAIEFFKKKPEYFFCVSDPSGQYKESFENPELKNVLFITEKHSFYKLMTLADVMLRPTATDGDALSVKEGLFLKKKVIATDRVDRPEGVLLFHYNDSESLTHALSLIPTFNDELLKERVAERLIEIYKHLVKDK